MNYYYQMTIEYGMINSCSYYLWVLAEESAIEQ